MTPRTEKVIAAIKAGARVVDIAARFGLSRARIYQVMAYHGVSRPVMHARSTGMPEFDWSGWLRENWSPQIIREVLDGKRL